MSNYGILNSLTKYRLKFISSKTSPKEGDLVISLNNQENNSVSNIFSFVKSDIDQVGAEFHLCKKGSSLIEIYGPVVCVKPYIVVNGIYEITFYRNENDKSLISLFVDTINMNNVLLDSENNPNKYFRIVKYPYNLSQESLKLISNLTSSNVLFDNYRILHNDINLLEIENLPEN